MKRPDTEEGIGQSTTKENQSEPHFTGGRVIDRRNFLKLGLGAITTAAIGESVLNHFLNLSKAEAAGLFGELGVNAEWLTLYHPNIQAAIDGLDSLGNVVKRIVAVNNTVFNLESSVKNSILYLADVDGSTFHAYRPVSEIPLKNVKTIVSIPGTSMLIAAGSISYHGGYDTGVVVSIDGGKKWGSNIWPYAPSGATTDLIPIDGTNIIYGNNRRFEGEGVQGFLLDLNGSKESVQIRALMIDSIREINLPPAGNPRITANSDGTFQIISLAFERQGNGVDIALVDPRNATATFANYYPNELKRAVGLTQNGRQIFITNPDNQFIKGFELDSEGRPTGINYERNFADWFNDVGIPGIMSNRTRIYSLLAKPGFSGNDNIWFTGKYTSDDNHGVIGHFLENTNPSLDPGALYWKDLGPWDVPVIGPTQNQLQFKDVLGQHGLEFPVNYPHSVTKGFSGLEFWPMKSDFSPIPDAQPSFPCNGLEISIIHQAIYQAFLPGLFNRFIGGW